MESISNAASSVVNTASTYIYGQPEKEGTGVNETGGKEPLSGEQGKGTATEPFDQGNKDTATTGGTSYKQDDFVKLDPAVDSAKASGLNEVKPEGAPGAGPAPPANVTPAKPDESSSTPSKVEEPPAAKDSAADDKPADVKKEEAKKEEKKDEKKDEKKGEKKDEKKDENSAPPRPMRENSAGGDADKILEEVPKSEHTVDDSQANNPHSKMTGKTVRQTEASQHGESDNSKSLADDKPSNSSEKPRASEQSGKSGETSDDKGGEGGQKMSTKDKLKQKLHIGSKDK